MKPRLRLKAYKNHPYQKGMNYKLKILGRKATYNTFAPNGIGADFSNAINILLKSE